MPFAPPVKIHMQRPQVVRSQVKGFSQGKEPLVTPDTSDTRLLRSAHILLGFLRTKAEHPKLSDCETAAYRDIA